MLSAEQTSLVRTQIANVLNVGADKVVPGARLFGDLGGTPEHLKPLRLAIETAINVQIEPIVNEVNVRTAVDQQGLVTKEAMTQIVDYLGQWPEMPNKQVSFPDLFTVGMIEAIAAKACNNASATVEEPPLELSPELRNLVRKAIAKVCKLPLDQLHSELKIETPGGDFNVKFTQALVAAGSSLNVDFSIELQELVQGLKAYSEGTATPLTMRKLRRLVPNVESLPDDGEDHTSTVGTIERICAAAIERRKSPPTVWDKQTRHVLLGHYISGWPSEDQDWWINLPDQIGPAQFRLYLTGMLRAAFVEYGSLDRQINEALEVAEDYAETGHSAELLDKRFRGVSSWKLGRNPLWSGLLNVLKPECTHEDGGSVLSRVEHAFKWSQRQVITAARAWQRSMVSPLKAPSEFDVKWCTEEVATLARQMHDNRIFVDFPKLGTLLEAAGCTVPAILDHCRDPQCRHLRGDWLINAILVATPPTSKKTSRGKASSAAAKPKKIKFPTMSYQLKKRYKEQLTSRNSGLPVATAWASSWQSNHASKQADYQRQFPNLPADVLVVLGGMYPARINVMPDAAIARRMELQSAAELYTGLALWARMSLLIWHTKPYRFQELELLQDAFASGDTASLQWAIRELPYDPRMETEVESWSYLALRAIATRDDSLISRLIDRWPHPTTGDSATPFETGLLAILRRDAPAVIATMNLILDEQRGSDEPQGVGVVSLSVHALHRAAHWLAPALVEGFDVTQTFPWDAEFYTVSTATLNPLEGFDFSNTPPLLRDLLLTQAIPQWLRDMARPERKD